MARHPVTIKDIAQELGISHTTVSRALADHPHISLETKARVQSAAARMGYVAHFAARMMRGQRSTLIGLIVPDIQNDFYATVAKALAETCNEAGFQLVLAITEDDPDGELRHVRELAAVSAAGVVIVPSRAIRRATIDLLAELPVVQLIRSHPAIASDRLGIDDTACIAEATRYLLGLGHRRIAYVGGHAELSSGAARLGGFRAALAEAGLAADPANVHVGPPRAVFGRAAATRLLDGRPAPSAIVTGGSRITLGVLDVLDERRVRVPEDLSLVGFGDPPWFRWWRSGITTVGLPVRDIAMAAGTTVLRRIREDAAAELPAAHRLTTFRAELVVRGSAAAPRVEATAVS